MAAWGAPVTATTAPADRWGGAGTATTCTAAAAEAASTAGAEALMGAEPAAPASAIHDSVKVSGNLVYFKLEIIVHMSP